MGNDTTEWFLQDTSEVASPTHPPALRVASLDTSDLDTSIGKKKASQSNVFIFILLTHGEMFVNHLKNGQSDVDG